MDKSFSEILKDAIGLRGLNLVRLAELTGIPKKHLIAFIEADFKKLPPLPYCRGYLMKVAEVLDINNDNLWNLFKGEVDSFQIKINDNLPINRFAIKRFNRRKILLGIALIFVIIYLIVQFNDLIGLPKIKIVQPEVSGIMTNQPFFRLSGEINNFFDKLTINGEEISVNKDGNFEKEIKLQLGVNKIEFKAKRFLGKETKVEKEIIYQL